MVSKSVPHGGPDRSSGDVCCVSSRPIEMRHSSSNNHITKPHNELICPEQSEEMIQKQILQRTLPLDRIIAMWIQSTFLSSDVSCYCIVSCFDLICLEECEPRWCSIGFCFELRNQVTRAVQHCRNKYKIDH